MSLPDAFFNFLLPSKINGYWDGVVNYLNENSKSVETKKKKSLL